MLNQDWVLAEGRRQIESTYPAKWSVREYAGKKQVWMTLRGHEGWYQPWTEGERVVYLQDESLGYSNLHRFLSGKMARKILEVVGKQEWKPTIN